MRTSNNIRSISSEPALTRRTFLRLAGVGLISVPITGGLLSSCINSDSAGGGGQLETVPEATAMDEADPTPTGTAQPEPEFPEAHYGGDLRIALIDEPPTLDIHQTTTSTTAFVSWHIFEALFTWDAELHVMPELPEVYTVTPDGLSYRFVLREDVMFHDGAPLTAQDVVASIKRWGRIVGLGQSLIEAVDEFVIEDDRTFEIRLSEPFGSLPVALARQNQGCAIYPQWAIEESGDDSLQSLIGTGPYRFVEFVPDQHILLERFEVYAPAPGEVDGYGGNKHRFLDQLMFVAVPDEAARVSGLRAGDFDYLESISPDQLEGIDDDPGVVVSLSDACCYPNLVINQRSDLMGNQHIRRAVQLALDHEPILLAGYGDGYYRLDPSLLMRETPWHTRAGAEYYDVFDVDQAARLLQEAEYDGTPVRFMVTEAYRDLYNASVMIAQQLQDAGFEIDFQQLDWASLSDRRNDPDLWDLYLTLATFRPDPIMRNLTCTASGWWCDEEKDELLHLVQAEAEFETRFEYWEEVQRRFYEHVPRIKVGDTYPVLARAARLQNFPELTQLQPSFWNSWIDED